MERPLRKEIAQAKRNMSERGRLLQRIGELALGHTVNTLVLGYAFDYVLYPFAIWKLGLLKGGVSMAFLSLVTCLLTLWFYDWSQRDWLGIEAVKQLRDGEAKTRWRRVLASARFIGTCPRRVRHADCPAVPLRFCRTVGAGRLGIRH
jgi:hypothetical protein